VASVTIHYQVIFTLQRMELTVKRLALIELDNEVPERAEAILGAIPRLEVRRGNRQTLKINGGTHALLVLGGIAPYAKVTAKLITELVRPGRIPLVVTERLSKSVRMELEKAGCSYVDGTGAAHLEGPGFLVHIDPNAGRQEGALPVPRGLGAVSVRAIQVLLTEPKQPWSVTELAMTAEVSTGEAHKVLKRLESEGFITTSGLAGRKRRVVSNPAELLDWLATVPAARKIHSRLGGFIYGSNVDDAFNRIAFNAQKSKMNWAITGAAAARIMGVRAVTAVPTTLIRVPSKPGLLTAATELGIEPVDSGANVVLIADVGDVGTRQAIPFAPVRLAPPVRIWLDMLGEPRGEDAAALFREAALEY